MKRLADENQQAGFKLMLGIFPMNAENTPGVQSVLKKYALAYIPEAHNYLMYHDNMLDFTGIGINTTKFRLDLLDETKISPDQVTDYKVTYHRDFLANWIIQHNIPYSIDQLWKIREECIEALQVR